MLKCDKFDVWSGIKFLIFYIFKLERCDVSRHLRCCRYAGLATALLQIVVAAPWFATAGDLSVTVRPNDTMEESCNSYDSGAVMICVIGALKCVCVTQILHVAILRDARGAALTA